MHGAHRLNKLLARLDSPHRAEAVASAGKVYDYLNEHGGSWRDLLGSRLVRVPRHLPKRVKRARQVVHFLAPSEREQLARISGELEVYAALPQEDLEFLDIIFLRTRV